MAKEKAKPRARRGRGEGSIEELPSGKFRVVVSAGVDPGTGRRRKLTQTCDTKKEAMTWRAEQLKQVRGGTAADAGRMTVGEWLDKWLTLRKASVESGTHAQYGQHVRIHLKPHLGAGRLSELRPLHVVELYRKLGEAGVSPSMCAKVGTTLRTALKHAVKLHVLPNNVALAVDKPKHTRPTDIEAWTAAEARAFLAAVESDRLAALYALALDSGMRQGELFALHWPAVDLDAGAVHVRQSLEERDGKFRLKDVKTKSSRRRVRLSSATAAALRSHMGRQVADGLHKPDGLVFTDTQGGFLRKSNLLRCSFRPAVKRAGVRAIRFHDMRHTCATLLLLNGVNIKAVSARLGHANAQTTLNIYAHTLPQMDDQMAGVMGLLLYAADGAGRDSPTIVP